MGKPWPPPMELIALHLSRGNYHEINSKENKYNMRQNLDETVPTRFMQPSTLDRRYVVMNYRLQRR